MCDEMGATLAANSDLSPDAPETRAIMQAGETEATAWAFAAGRAIGLPAHVIIEDKTTTEDGGEFAMGSLSPPLSASLGWLAEGGWNPSEPIHLCKIGARM